jgi:drug/metabolite transporter (DMT)-like permease
MNLIWAGSYVATKFGLKTMSPLAFVFWRMGVAAVLLLMWIFIRRMKWQLAKRDVVRIVTLGAVIAGSHFLWVTGLNYTSASDASLLYAFEPIWSIILASFILKERFSVAMGLGLGLAFVGLVILSNIQTASFGSFFTASVALGNLMIVVGLFCESLFSIVAKPLALRQSAIVVIALALVVTEILLAGPLFLSGSFSVPKTITEIGAVAYLAIPCTVVGYVLWVNVMQYIPVNVMLYTIFVQPVVGPVIATVVLKEVLEQRHFKGGLFILAGVCVAIVSHLFTHRENVITLASPAIASESD